MGWVDRGSAYMWFCIIATASGHTGQYFAFIMADSDTCRPDEHGPTALTDQLLDQLLVHFCVAAAVSTVSMVPGAVLVCVPLSFASC